MITVNNIASPVQERVANLETRVRELRANVDLWNVCAGIETFESFDEVRKQVLLSFFMRGDDARAKKEFSGWGEEIGRIRRHLNAAVVLLGDQLPSFEMSLSRVKGLLRAFDMSGAFRSLLALEAQCAACSKFAENINALVAFRVSDRTCVEFSALDSLAAEVYGAVAYNGRTENLALAPLCDSRSFVEEGIYANGCGVSCYPLSMVTISASTFSRPWNLVKAWSAICGKVYWDLGIDPDVERIVQQLLAAAPRSVAARELLLRWRADISKEVMATCLGGPAYASAQLEERLCRSEAIGLSALDLLPPYLAWLVQCYTLRVLGFSREAQELSAVITSIYGPMQFVTQYSAIQPVLGEVAASIELVVDILTTTPLSRLGGGKIGDVLPLYDHAAHIESLGIAEEIVKRAGLPSAGVVAARQKEDESAAPAKGRRQGKAETQAEEASDALPLQYHVAACRLAFERVSTEAEFYRSLLSACRTSLSAAVDKYYRTPQHRKQTRDLSADEIRKLRRKGSAVYEATPAVFNVSPLGMF